LDPVAEPSIQGALQEAFAGARGLLGEQEKAATQSALDDEYLASFFSRIAATSPTEALLVMNQLSQVFLRGSETELSDLLNRSHPRIPVHDDHIEAYWDLSWRGVSAPRQARQLPWMFQRDEVVDVVQTSPLLRNLVQISGQIVQLHVFLYGIRSVNDEPIVTTALRANAQGIFKEALVSFLRERGATILIRKMGAW